jgi:hypothetical protein
MRMRLSWRKSGTVVAYGYNIGNGKEATCVWKSKIAREILTYLLEHPDAQDTLDGIAQWWIPEQKIRTHIGTVKKVITELVAKELIHEHRGRDWRVHYRVNGDKTKEIKNFLGAQTGQEKKRNYHFARQRGDWHNRQLEPKEKKGE